MEKVTPLHIYVVLLKTTFLNQNQSTFVPPLLPTPTPPLPATLPKLNKENIELWLRV